MKKRFEVLAGKHIETIDVHDKKTYNKGDIVISSKDLCAIFPQKFKDLGPSEEREEEDLVGAGADGPKTRRRGKSAGGQVASGEQSPESNPNE